MMKVKVCFLCKQYTPIHPDNPLSQDFVKDFEKWHHEHPIQTINIEEVPKGFQCITLKNRREAMERLAVERLGF